MDYRDYQNARDMTWRILLDMNVTRLPVMVGKLCRELGITVKYGDGDGDGRSVMVEGNPVIMLSRSCTAERQRFTCAHELGHILLGHVGKYRLINREPSSGDNPVEQAANVFASRLLAPACVLWGCGVRTPEEIAALCRISYQAARFRAERMELLYRRGRFLTSPMERVLYERFLPFIREYRS